LYEFQGGVTDNNLIIIYFLREIHCKNKKDAARAKPKKAPLTRNKKEAAGATPKKADPPKSKKTTRRASGDETFKPRLNVNRTKN